MGNKSKLRKRNIWFLFFFKVRGINEATRNVQNLNAEELVRLWAHEALRLFHDR